jgi:transposase
MPAAISITRLDYTAAELRREAKRTDDADAARRMLALALVLEGKSRAEAAKSCGMDLQILCDWVHRYNAEGLQGLHNRTAPGAKPRLSSEQEREVAELVRKGPNLAEHGVVRWRRIDLSHVIEQRYKPERRRPAVTQGRALVRFLTSPGARWVLGGDFVEVDFFFGESRLHPSAGKFDQAFPNIRLFSFFGQVETLTRICVVLLRRLNHGHTQPSN